jgi:hypothetical protein
MAIECISQVRLVTKAQSSSVSSCLLGVQDISAFMEPEYLPYTSKESATLPCFEQSSLFRTQFLYKPV